MDEQEQPDETLSLAELDKMVTRFGKELDAGWAEVQEGMRNMKNRLPSVPGEDIVVTWEAHDLVNGGHLVWIEGSRYEIRRP